MKGSIMFRKSLFLGLIMLLIGQAKAQNARTYIFNDQAEPIFESLIKARAQNKINDNSFWEKENILTTTQNENVTIQEILEQKMDQTQIHFNTIVKKVLKMPAFIGDVVAIEGLVCAQRKKNKATACIFKENLSSLEKRAIFNILNSIDQASRNSAGVAYSNPSPGQMPMPDQNKVFFELGGYDFCRSEYVDGDTIVTQYFFEVLEDGCCQE